MKLEGNTILITGGTSGIGQAMAVAFYNEGSTVIICGRRKVRLDEMAAKYPGMITRVCDIADAGQREELAAWATSAYPALNILINNAGMQLATDLKKPADVSLVRDEIETNLVAPIHLSSLFAPHLQALADAAIINISSGLAFVPLAFMPVYCATKAALHSFTMSLRYQLKDTSIKVFEIAPPSTDTELGHQRRADKTQSHGGISIELFLTEAMQAIKDDLLEAPIADAKGLRAKGEALFIPMNERVRPH